MRLDGAAEDGPSAPGMGSSGDWSPLLDVTPYFKESTRAATPPKHAAILDQVRLLCRKAIYSSLDVAARGTLAALGKWRWE